MNCSCNGGANGDRESDGARHGVVAFGCSLRRVRRLVGHVSLSLQAKSCLHSGAKGGGYIWWHPGQSPLLSRNKPDTGATASHLIRIDQQVPASESRPQLARENLSPPPAITSASAKIAPKRPRAKPFAPTGQNTTNYSAPRNNGIPFAYYRSGQSRDVFPRFTALSAAIAFSALAACAIGRIYIARDRELRSRKNRK